MEKQMTIREVLEITARNLREIAVPVTLMESIGKPVLGCAQNIDACLQAIDKAEGGGKDGPEPDAE